MEDRCDYEDNTEPVMKTNPLVLCQGKHSPACPVRNSSGRNKKKYNTGKGHAYKGKCRQYRNI